MNDILTKVQALQTADDAALASIVTDIQAFIAATPTAAAVTLVSVVATFSDGSTQSLPVVAA